MLVRLALLAFCCGVALSQPSTDAGTFTVVLQGQRLPASILTAMQREVQSAVMPAGLHLIWRPWDLGHGEVPGSVAIVTMRGQCSSSPGSLLSNSAGYASAGEPLGQTHMADGKVLPFADILCDAVHRLVDRDLRNTSPLQRDALLGRALGRVMAHELYHILLNSRDHDRQGLGRSEQSRTELLEPTNSFSDRDDRRMANSLAVSPGDSGR